MLQTPLNTKVNKGDQLFCILCGNGRRIEICYRYMKSRYYFNRINVMKKNFFCNARKRRAYGFTYSKENAEKAVSKSDNFLMEKPMSGYYQM
jgi:NADH dehydrogenase/NADH:ubiquinone oxidoreductase subunit G